MSLIQSLIIGSETKKAIEVTAKLAKLNRSFLSNSNKELIMLKEELDFIKEYVAMEKMRFESDTNFPFQIKVNSEVHLTDWLIPPLILQPILENAIKHGVLVAKNSAEIIIDIQLLNPNTLSIDIINTQVTQSKKRSAGMGMGTQLVADRLAIFNELYPIQFTAKFDSGLNDNKEFHANIRIEKHFDSKGTNEGKSLQNEEFTPMTKTLNNQIMGGVNRYKSII
jgi:LytS/YehU family sensor histidine kinase